MTFHSFLDRLVRRIPLIARLEQENELLRVRLKAVENTADGIDTALGCLDDRVKEIEDDYQTEADVSNEIDEQLAKYDPWNDPSFTGEADEWLAKKFGVHKDDLNDEIRCRR